MGKASLHPENSLLEADARTIEEADESRTGCDRDDQAFKLAQDDVAVRRKQAIRNPASDTWSPA